MEINTYVLSAGSALSSGIVPARNHVLFQITTSRKLPPPARFILPGAVFHWDGQPGAVGAREMSLFEDYDPDESQDLHHY
ncbi:hypothetical protein [Daejeonella sp.]|uniref:hypothetical protein n=1 Tax=Daejeonella sp. TaxID=2805397 RepID=UPI002715A5AF|nr:hypothetical protein [Daejeonella sp.]MDO8992701.1 hypothetical protein [Daejeonella sp.]MDP2412367.1 hypothetical protein [Daejeonella sp.]